MKFKIKNLVNLNPRQLHTESKSERNKELDKRFRQEIINEVGIYPESEKRFAKYNDKVCDICNQDGCDYRIKCYPEYFHKKCYDLLVNKAVMHTIDKKTQPKKE